MSQESPSAYMKKEFRPHVTPTDRMRAREVHNHLSLVHEHLEAMRRDSHGLEYSSWKREVDGVWRRIFAQIDRMSAGPQQSSLQTIKEAWTMYLTHYAVAA